MPDKRILVVAIGAILFIPFLGSVHLFDWDEVNFAESSREMLLTKDFFHVQINYQPFQEKPPLFFWLQALCMSLFGVNELAARLPNALCGIVTLLLVFHIGKKYFSERFAWLWVLFITGSLTPHLYFKSGIIDPVFNLFIFLSVYQAFLLTQAAGKNATKHVLLMSVCCGLAVLTKGPVAIIVLGLVAMVYWISNGFRLLVTFKQILLSILVITVITSIWFLSELMQNGPRVLVDFIVYQAELFSQPVAGHGQPWYYHTVVLLFGAFPASVFAIMGFITKATTLSIPQREWKKITAILFWSVLILFSIVETKIVHYSSLCYLPLAFFAALGVDRALNENRKFSLAFNMAAFVPGALVGIALTAIPFIDSFKDAFLQADGNAFVRGSLSVAAPWNGREYFAGVLFLLVMAVYQWLSYRGRFETAVRFLLGGFSILIPVMLWQIAPKIEAYSQGPAIRFYESLQGKNCYVETLGFKSYAQYFYPRIPPRTGTQYADKNWLLTGPIDRPAYFVVKAGEEKNAEQYHLRELKREGGFIFFERIAADTFPQ